MANNNKKTEEVTQEQNDDLAPNFDDIFEERKVEPPIYSAVFHIGDIGQAGKSMDCKGLKEVLMRLGVSHDTYVADGDHMQNLETYGLRDASGELVAHDKLDPTFRFTRDSNGRIDKIENYGCGFFNIRKAKQELVNTLQSPSKFKFYDMPASSMDELYDVFGDMYSFLNAFVNARTKLIFVVPVFDADKSVKQGIGKLQDMLCDVHPDAVIEFAFLFKNGLMLENQISGVQQEYKRNASVKKLKDRYRVTEVTIAPSFSSILKNRLPTAKLFDLFYTRDEAQRLPFFEQEKLEQILNTYKEATKKILF
ncbi:hypothetical protein LFL96_25990 [Paraburkholderia sp. D15]|uniref:hypothetical protein n=1 Tax=Paraburkholderia sp. D15 TaxID=2880218 RepID=UPI00247A22D9|nr:hypothetical protein [Paraburkholderia sp. D15]WGS54468.1 hypothetical protein LFL96_25990 [Paraburkholderia sp. D15]